MATNPHGNGLAWMDNVKGHLFVHWKKGIKDEDVKNLVKNLGNTMVVFHARIATVGGTNGLLTHPFPVTLNPRLQYNGVDDMVLFHNGHYSGWEKLIPEASLKSHEYAWSDSRAIAHGLASGQVKIEDLGKAVGGVFAILSTKPFNGDANVGTVEHYGDWEKLDDGVWASNTNFLAKGNRGIYWDFTKSGKGGGKYKRYWDKDAWEYGSNYYNSGEYDRHSLRYSI